eukprot:2306226-Pyramimonas_sp.AAC.1
MGPSRYHFRCLSHWARGVLQALIDPGRYPGRLSQGEASAPRQGPRSAGSKEGPRGPRRVR